MNSETIQTLAADAIAVWAREHNGPCELIVKDGRVIAQEPSEYCMRHQPSLFISRFDQKLGLTTTKWSRVGTELYNLYNKEIACQAHQKH